MNKIKISEEEKRFVAKALSGYGSAAEKDILRAYEIAAAAWFFIHGKSAESDEISHCGCDAVTNRNKMSENEKEFWDRSYEKAKLLMLCGFDKPKLRISAKIWAHDYFRLRSNFPCLTSASSAPSAEEMQQIANGNRVVSSIMEDMRNDCVHALRLAKCYCDIYSESAEFDVSYDESVVGQNFGAAYTIWHDIHNMAADALNLPRRGYTANDLHQMSVEEILYLAKELVNEKENGTDEKSLQPVVELIDQEVLIGRSNKETKKLAKIKGYFYSKFF